MKPMPKEIAERWSPMWEPNAHHERPWWAWLGAAQRWKRCDGFVLTGTHDGSLDPYRPPAWSLMPWKKGYVYEQDDVPETEAHIGMLAEVLVAIDTAHPLAAPPPMPGQVWWNAEWGDMVVGPVSPDAHASLTYWAYPGPYLHSGPTVWPSPGAVLVSGPTPWGMNVPWSPA